MPQYPGKVKSRSRPSTPPLANQPFGPSSLRQCPRRVLVTPCGPTQGPVRVSREVQDTRREWRPDRRAQRERVSSKLWPTRVAQGPGGPGRLGAVLVAQGVAPPSVLGSRRMRSVPRLLDLVPLRLATLHVLVSVVG